MNSATQVLSSAPITFEHANIDAIRIRQHTAQNWLWQGLLMPGNITLFTSLWKSGKTTLISVLLARLASGGTLAGLPVRQGRAAVISEEAEEHWLARDELLHFGPNIHFFTRPFHGRPSPEQWQNLVDQLHAMHRQTPLDLVVIDPLASFMPSRSENHASAMLDDLLPLQQLTSEGICVLMLHHPKKGETADAQAARGSGALTGHMDIIREMKWFGRPTEDDRRRTLTAYSRHKETPRRLVIELTADGTDYISHGDYATPEVDSGWSVLFGVLEDADKKLTRKEIRDAWPQDFSKPDDVTLWRWLDRAAKAGKCKVEGDGRKTTPFLYWLDGMEDVWASDPFPKVELPPMDEVLGVRRKTLQEVLAEREAEQGKKKGKRSKGKSKEPSLEDMMIATQLRANGVAWPAIAHRLKIDEDTCRDWQHRYPAKWKELMAAARQEVRKDLEAEAIVVLKSQLTSPDEKLRIEAANLLAEHRESKTQPEPIDNDEYRGGIPQRIVCPKMGSSWD